MIISAITPRIYNNSKKATTQPLRHSQPFGIALKITDDYDGTVEVDGEDIQALSLSEAVKKFETCKTRDDLDEVGYGIAKYCYNHNQPYEPALFFIGLYGAAPSERIKDFAYSHIQNSLAAMTRCNCVPQDFYRLIHSKNLDLSYAKYEQRFLKSLGQDLSLSSILEAFKKQVGE